MDKIWTWMKMWPPIVGWIIWCGAAFIARGGIYRDSVGNFFGAGWFVLLVSVLVFGPLAIALLRGLPVEKIALIFTGGALFYMGLNFNSILVGLVSTAYSGQDGPSVMWSIAFAGLGISFYSLLMKAYAVKPGVSDKR